MAYPHKTEKKLQCLPYDSKKQNTSKCKGRTVPVHIARSIIVGCMSSLTAGRSRRGRWSGGKRSRSRRTRRSRTCHILSYTANGTVGLHDAILRFTAGLIRAVVPAGKFHSIPLNKYKHII